MKRLGVILSLLSASVCYAETEPYVGFGLAYGGDKLATITFTDESDEDLLAGAGYTMAIGVVKNFEDSPLAIQGTVGYFVDETSARNSRARFSRYPIEVLAVYRDGNHRFGGGLTHHLSPTLNMDNLGEKFDFDSATGFVMEYGYRYFSVRYTRLSYSIGNSDIDGSGIGIFAEMGF